jgi:hypothetical protein
MFPLKNHKTARQNGIGAEYHLGELIIPAGGCVEKISHHNLDDNHGADKRDKKRYYFADPPIHEINPLKTLFKFSHTGTSLIERSSGSGRPLSARAGLEPYERAAFSCFFGSATAYFAGGNW